MIVLSKERKAPKDSFYGVFEAIVSGIKEQGCLANVPGTLTPKYRVFTETKTYACPVGWLIPDIKYSPSIEGLSVEELPARVLTNKLSRRMAMLSVFQDYHDRAVVSNSGDLLRDGALLALDMVKTEKDKAFALFLSVPWHEIKVLGV